MCFDQSFTPLPTCCPARQALICGRRPERYGALLNYDQGIPVHSLTPDAFSWARELNADGYKTAYVGKWHVSPKYTPLDFGYDVYISEWDLSAPMKKKHPNCKFEKSFFGEKSPFPLEDSPTHQNAAHVIRLIDEYENGPWHIKMDFAEPHLPCRPSEPFASMYDHEDIPRWHAFDDPLTDKPYIQKQMLLNWKTEAMGWEDFEETVKLYYGYISQVDDAIGRVIEHLRKKNMLDNTIIIYTADHGDMCGDRHMMDKHYIMYEEVIHVPLVIRAPMLSEGGRRCDAIVTNMLDLVPTILEMAGLEAPENSDAISLMPYLKGEEHPSPRRYALTTYNGQQFGLYLQRMIRDKRWKYTWNPTDVDELYDLEKDPYELQNLVHDPSHAEILQKLRIDLFNELLAVNDFTTHGRQWMKDQLLLGRKI